MMTESFPLLIPNQITNTLREEGVILSQSTMKKYSHEFLKAKKWNTIQWPSQSHNLNPIKDPFQIVKTKLKEERPTNQLKKKADAVKLWQSRKHSIW